MAISSIKMIVPCQCLLGEGPYFSQTFNSLFWVDILSHELYQLNFTEQVLVRIKMDEPICWLVETHEQQLIAGFEKSIYYLDNKTLQKTKLYQRLDEPSNNRLNDAKTDRNGYLFFGTMDKSEQRTTGSVYRVGHSKPLKQIDKNYVISNGPAINKSGNKLYSTESSTQTIYQFDLTADGEAVNKRVFTKFTQEMGFPDGMTVDDEDHLWVAAWNGFGLYRFSPHGLQIDFYRLPVPRVTSLTFIGPDLKTIAVTTARVGLDQAMLDKYPHSGNVFILESTTKGIAESTFVE